MLLRKFVRNGAGMATALSLMVSVAACGDDDDPVDPGNGDEPTLTSIAPSSGDQGEVVEVTLTGTNLDGANATVNVSGSGVTATITDSDATSITADFDIAGDATPGDRDVTVETDDGESEAETFTVNEPPAMDNTVDANDDLEFVPEATQVEVGTTVTWTNVGTTQPHNVTSTSTNWDVAGNLPDNGSTFEHTFDAAGTYDYECTVHAGMTGTVEVVEAENGGAT